MCWRPTEYRNFKLCMYDSKITKNTLFTPERTIIIYDLRQLRLILWSEINVIKSFIIINIDWSGVHQFFYRTTKTCHQRYEKIRTLIFIQKITNKFMKNTSNKKRYMYRICVIIIRIIETRSDDCDVIEMRSHPDNVVPIWSPTPLKKCLS